MADSDSSEGMNTRSHKRARGETPPCEVPHHRTLWFDDGNVVLVACTSMAFRVHKSVLALKSTVFRDMFAMPQPAEESKFVEGCAVVHVDDSSRELEDFLTLVYGGLK